MIASKYPELQGTEAREPLYGGGKVSDLRAGLAGAADTALFGSADEMKAGLQGLVKGGFDPNITIGEAYEHFLGKARGEAEQLQEENPYAYGGGQVAGAFAPVGSGLKAATGLGKYAKAAGIGGVSGGLYGFGSGEGGAEERLESAVPAGLAGMAGGVALTGAASVGGRVSRPLLEKAQRVFGKKPASKLPVPKDVIPEEVALKTEKGQVLDLTKGQATQDPKLQSLEIAALKGGLKDTLGDSARAAESMQQGQMRGVLEGFEPKEESLKSAASAVRGSFKSIKAKVNRAYEDARITQGVYVNKEPLQEVFKPQVKAMLRNGGFDVTDMTPADRDWET